MKKRAKKNPAKVVGQGQNKKQTLWTNTILYRDDNQVEKGKKPLF